MTTYTLTVSTNDLGLGVINGARVVVERRRTQVTDIFNGQLLSKNSTATNSLGVATILLEPDDGSVYHELKVFDLAGILVYSKIFTMPPQAVAVAALPVQDIISESAAQAVNAAADAAADAVATAADRVQTGLDAVATAADRVQTGLDAVATAADAVATAADAVATAADRVQTGIDAVATAADAATALAAKDIAIQSANIYASTALGLAATTNGQYFSVPLSGNPISSVEIYKNNAGVALYITSLPSSAITQTLRDNQSGQARYVGTGDYPIVTDSSGFVLLSVSKTTGKVTAYGLIDEATAATIAQEKVYYTQALQKYFTFVGVGDDVPLLTDSEGRILIGVNKTTGELIADINTDSIESVLALKGHNLQQRKQVSGTVTAVLTDNEGRVLLGFDSETSKIVGAIEATSTSTYTLENLANPIIERQINHFLFYGQSLSVGASGQSALSTTQPYSNITFTGGVKSTKSGGTGWNAGLGGFKPLVEDNITGDYEATSYRGETVCSGAAKYATELRAIEDGLLTNSHIILASTAGHGGYSISQLSKASADVTHDSTNTVVSPTNWYGVLLDQITAAKTIATAGSKTYGVPVVGWLQGEADRTMASATYVSNLIALKNDIKADVHTATSNSDPMYFLTYQSPYGAALSDTQVHLAQLAAAQQDDDIFLASPCYFMPSADGTHLTNVGYIWLGHYFGRAYKQLVSGKKPKWINPISATARTTTLTVKFDVPVSPLRFDAITLPSTTDKGFKVVDDTGTLTLSDIQVINGDSVKITINRALGTNPVVRYAIDYLGTGCQFTSGASGNLCDSDLATVTINSSVKPMFNVCPHFKLNIIKLG